MYNTEYFINKAKELKGNNVIGIAGPYTPDHIIALGQSLEYELITKAYLIGEEEKIKAAISETKYEEDIFEIVHADDFPASAAKLLEFARDGVINILMKGSIDTSILLGEVLKKEYGMRTGKTIAHIALLFNHTKDKYYIVSDAGVNITPTLEQKKDIIEHCVNIAHNLGNPNPNVAMLAAKEKVYDKMPATVDAGALHEMNKNGEITGCVVSGPLQLDNAVDPEAARIKGVQDPVAGNADILIVPTIEVGNVFAKGLWKMADNWRFIGIIAGAKLPVVLSSRADDAEGLLGGIAFSCLKSTIE